MHPPEFAVDGLETWWQSPPLSRGRNYNAVNLTIDLGQVIIFYVFKIYFDHDKNSRLTNKFYYTYTYSYYQGFGAAFFVLLTNSRSLRLKKVAPRSN